MASSNDVKSAKRVKDILLAFVSDVQDANADTFQKKYNTLLIELQHDISQMGPNPVVSLAASSVERRVRREQGLSLHVNR